MTTNRTSRISRTWTTCYSMGELRLIEVEVMIRTGIPRFDIIGLPQNVIREGKGRILAALSHLGIELASQKVLVSLTPGDVAKEGSHFDLPILVGILKALGLLLQIDGKDFYWGELELNGRIRPLPEIIAHVIHANQFDPSRMIHGGRLTKLKFLFPYLRLEPRTLESIEALLHLANPVSEMTTLPVIQSDIAHSVFRGWSKQVPANSGWNSLRGSPEQFLFWCIVMLGRHHVLLEGPPGVGKSSWCYAVREIQLPLGLEHWTDRFRFHPLASAAITDLQEMYKAPFEAPHHSTSKAAIMGGGSGLITSGAITRAHRGTLFLDEFAEFPRDVLECLREPLENKTITIARRGSIATFPADVQLLAAMNPCRCGNADSSRLCVCSSSQFLAYQSRVSSPLRDRFHVNACWRFENSERAPEFELQKVRERLVELRSQPRPALKSCQLPQHLNPRRQKIVIEFLMSWARWRGITEITNTNYIQCAELLTHMEESTNGKNISKHHTS